jgi:alanine racemase
MVKIDDPLFTAGRSGICMYGYNHLDPADPHYSDLDALQPALRITSTVTSLQTLATGDAISYGQKRSAAAPTTTATIPFGYHEGLMRSLTNQRQVKREEHMLPLVGTICMNLSCLDTHGYPVARGDEIEIVSPEKKDRHTIQRFADLAGTIPYEILVNLDEKAKRVIV